MSDRADYIDGLRVERDNLSARPASPTQKRRLTEVEAELGRFSDEPTPARREKAVPPEGPISRTRKRAAKPAPKA